MGRSLVVHKACQTASAESLYQGVVQLVDKVLNDNDLRIQDTYGIGVGLPGR